MVQRYKFEMPKSRKAEMDDVLLAKEVTSIKNHPHAEMNSSESHQAHGDSDDVHSNGARNAKSARRRVEDELREITFVPS